MKTNNEPYRSNILNTPEGLKLSILKKLLLVFVFALIPLRSNAVELDPPSKFLSDNQTQTALVTLHHKNQIIEANVINRKDFDLPNSIKVSLVGESGKTFDMELSASELSPIQRNGAFMRNYRGVLPSNFESYVGVEIKIPFYNTPHNTLYARPMRVSE